MIRTWSARAVLLLWSLAVFFPVGRTAEVFTVLLVLYFLLSRPIVYGVKWIENHRQWAV